MTQQSSGWYDDPEDPTHLRYFDGVQWTSHRAPKQLPAAPADPYTPGAARPEPTHDPYAAQDPYAGSNHAPGDQGYGQPWQGQGQQGQGADQQGGIPQAPAWQQPGPNQGSYPGGQPSWGRHPYGQMPQPSGMPFGTQSSAGRIPAGWWQRVGAYLIDGIIVPILAFVVTLPLTLPTLQRLGDMWNEAMRAAQAGEPAPRVDPYGIADANFYVGVFLATLIFVLYDALCTARWGKTIGKKLAGIRVVDAAGGATVPFTRALVRAVVKNISSLTPRIPVLSDIASLFTFVDYLSPLWDKPLRQAFHDKAAKSMVVRD